MRCSIQALGDKTSARELAQKCGVPVIPGTERATETTEEALKFASTAGFPVILKAAMGGGGRGMRVVQRGKVFAPIPPRLLSRNTNTAENPSTITHIVDKVD